ncbi:MAG: hypothetical protein Q9179_007031, partial [Wetmoreana sp. 5 TL-2023]
SGLVVEVSRGERNRKIYRAIATRASIVDPTDIIAQAAITRDDVLCRIGSPSRSGGCIPFWALCLGARRMK